MSVKPLKVLLAISFAVALTACASAPCAVPKFPTAPELAPPPADCPADAVCFTHDDAKALGLWLRELGRWRLVVESCHP